MFLSKGKRHVSAYLLTSPLLPPLPPGAFVVFGKPKKKKTANPSPTNLSTREVSKTLCYREVYGKTVTVEEKEITNALPEEKANRAQPLPVLFGSL